MSDSHFQPPPSINKPQQVAAPKTLGRYRILNEVGRGATAFVYKAYDPQLDRFLAIKVLRPELALDKDYRHAFLKEARLAAQLTHPGIVTLFDVGIADDKPYIAMELLEGATLEQILQAQGKLNLSTTLAMAVQLSNALSYAHKAGVVHRDIKPANIVILKDKKTVKLTDFGIAQLEDAGGFSHAPDKVLGTPEYMAPEQILGQPLDKRCDLYSFGALLFRMLSGRPPFVADDLGDLLKQIVKNKPPKLALNEARIEDDLQDLVRKLLQKKPLKRFDKTPQLTQELRSIQAKLGKRKPNEKTDFVSLRLRWTATMAGMVFVAMCIGLATVYWMQYRALSGITFDYGRSIARMLAFETAEPLLLDDSVGLNALVNRSSSNEKLTSVFVLDKERRILAATDLARVGYLFVAPKERKLKQTLDKSRVFQRTTAQGKIVFDVEIPILYGEKPLGELYVSFSADSMYAASKTTLLTMLAVMIVTLLVVFIVTLVLARRTSNDYKRVSEALIKMSQGRVDARLLSERNDEAGQLFSAFNRLAIYLESRLERRHPEALGKAVEPNQVQLNNLKRLSDKKNNELAATVELERVDLSQKE